MLRFLWSGCAALMILGSGLGATVSVAKPAELPVDLRVDLEDEETPNSITLSFDLFTGKLSLSFSLPWNLQTWLPGSAPRPEVLEPTAGGPKPPAQAGVRPNAACPPRETVLTQEQEATPPKVLEARAMFRIAERCLKNGDLDKARTCYEETHLLAPATRLGRLAIQRLADLDDSRTSTGEGTSEEQEPQDPARRQMLRNTVPLAPAPGRSRD